jgi:hypothetical protein
MVFKVKIIAKDIIKVSALALIKGATKAIAVAPHIAEPLDNKRINLLSKPTHLPIDKQIKKLNMTKNETQIK